MGSYNSLDEILEFAIAREFEAHQLYQYMATELEDSDIRLLCECFAKEELEHKGKLELEALKKRKGVKFQKCMGEGLRGKKFRGRAEAQKAFKKLVKVCKVR